ncbi:MAG: hypothetical protein R6U98_18795, partial [Pirellulaceae bacterium]
LDHLDDSGVGHPDIARLGYRIPDGDAQLDPLPWTNLDTIAVTFNADVSVSAEDLEVSAVNVPHYPVVTDEFAYDPATLTATWTLTEPLEADKLLLVLPDTVTNTEGIPLDGEWEDGVSTVSGDGTPGGDFQFRFNVLPGDVTNSENVVAGDVSMLASAFGSFAGGSDGRYSPFVDFDGSGNVVAGDVSILASHFGRFLPSDQPTLPANGATMTAAFEAKTMGLTDAEESGVTAASAVGPTTVLTATAPATPTASAASTACTDETDDYTIGTSKPFDQQTEASLSGSTGDSGTGSRSTGTMPAGNSMMVVPFTAHAHEARDQQFVGTHSISSASAPRPMSVTHFSHYYASSFPHGPSAREQSPLPAVDQTGYRGPAAGQYVRGIEARGLSSPSKLRILSGEDPVVRSAALEAVSLDLGADHRADPLLELSRDGWLTDGWLTDDLQGHEDDSDRWAESVDLALDVDRSPEANRRPYRGGEEANRRN